MLYVQPIPHEGLAGSALGLRDLVLVMGEYQVFPTGVNVERLAEFFDAHGGALDVPTGATFAPRSSPDGAHAAIFFAGRLPERKVTSVFLAIFIGVHGTAGSQTSARAHILELDARELAVPWQ